MVTPSPSTTHASRSCTTSPRPWSPALRTAGTVPAREALLGDAGIVDVTVLIGWFTAVSMTLAAFDVPADAVGLDQ